MGSCNLRSNQSVTGYAGPATSSKLGSKRLTASTQAAKPVDQNPMQMSQAHGFLRANIQRWTAGTWRIANTTPAAVAPRAKAQATTSVDVGWPFIVLRLKLRSGKSGGA